MEHEEDRKMQLELMKMAMGFRDQQMANNQSFQSTSTPPPSTATDKEYTVASNSPGISYFNL